MMKILTFSLVLLAASCELDFNKHGSRTPQSESVEMTSTASEYAVVEKASDDNESSVDKLCSLPREWINPEYFEKYCAVDRECLRPGVTCATHKHCCVGAAYTQRTLTIGEKCLNWNQCESGVCEKHPFKDYKICYGTNRAGLCSYNGELCLDRTNCCSNRCEKNRCLGTPNFPSDVGEFCMLGNNECSTFNCNTAKLKCRQNF